jgi:hypothetical protein
MGDPETLTTFVHKTQEEDKKTKAQHRKLHKKR